MSVIPVTDSQIADIVAMKQNGYSWEEITKHINKKYSLDKSKEAIRCIYKRNRHLFDMSDKEVAIRQLKDVVRTKRNNSRTQRENRLVLQEANRLDDIKEEFKEFLPKIQFKLHKPLKKKGKRKKLKRTLIAHISDTHIGNNVSKKEMAGVNQFNNTIAARRMALFVKQVAEFKLDKRNETELKIVLNGDIFTGIIHGQEHSVDLMTVQFANLISIFGQGISYLARHFKKVDVYCNTGNHDRFQHKADKGRASENKWDSFATLAYIALRERFKESYDNVKFFIPESPFCMFKIQKFRAYATHGDTMFELGNAGKNINIASIANKIDNINSSQLAREGIFNIFFLGHIHTPLLLQLDNGVFMSVNGALSGTDPYAQSIGICGNNPVQQIIEITEDFIGDARFIQLKDADADKSLDKIIEPLTDKF